jgi:hypothetical protein
VRGLFSAAFVTLVLSIRLALPLAAGPLEDGAAAAERGDYAAALGLCVHSPTRAIQMRNIKSGSPTM